MEGGVQLIDKNILGTVHGNSNAFSLFAADLILSTKYCKYLYCSLFLLYLFSTVRASLETLLLRRALRTLRNKVSRSTGFDR